MANDPNLIFPFNHTGVFTIGTGQPGAVTLNAFLTVPNNSSIVSGHGTLSQAIDPPLQGNTSFSGVVYSLGFGAAKQIYALVGTPTLLGQTTYVTSLFIVLDGDWGTKGTATYTYLKNGVPHVVADVPVKVQWLLQE